METIDFHGFTCKKFTFDSRDAFLVYPENPRPDGKWLFKTEYFGAFPEFELLMLEKGYYVAHVSSVSRWVKDGDTERQAAFAKYLHEEFGLCEKFFAVGMSCGGMQALYLAAKYPELAAGMYLDAPVVDLLYVLEANPRFAEEYEKNSVGTLSGLRLGGRSPKSHIKAIAEKNVPVFLACGDSDDIVNYDKNGTLLCKAYKTAGADITLSLVRGRGHHPHHPEDMKELVKFAERIYG